NYTAISTKGLSLRTRSFGDYTVKPHTVFPSISAAVASGGKWDYVVVTTKALPDAGDESKDIEGLVGEWTKIVLIQNGVGVEEPYRKRFADTPIVSGVTIVSAEQVRLAVFLPFFLSLFLCCSACHEQAEQEDLWGRIGLSRCCC